VRGKSRFLLLRMGRPYDHSGLLKGRGEEGCILAISASIPRHYLKKEIEKKEALSFV